MRSTVYRFGGAMGAASRGLWGVVAWLATVGFAAGGQIGGGSFVGDVRDDAGAAVPGATVTVRAVETAASRTAVTAADGSYRVQGLRPGRYELRVELSGFETVVRNGIGLATGETLRLDVRLRVGGTTESVTVTADAPLLRSE